MQCLLRQIVSHGSEDAITLLCEQRNKLASLPKADDLATVFTDVCRSQERLYLILDAVDELEGIKQVASFLKTFQTAGCSILITSRHHPDLSKALAPFREIALESSNPLDLHTYVQCRFEKSDFADAIQDMTPIVEAVVQRTDGL